MTKLLAGFMIAILGESCALADATETVSAPSCKKPVAPSSIRKADDTSEFDEKFDTYRTCIQDYATEQKKLAQQHVDAANSAITDLNAYITQVNDQRKN